MFLFLAYILIGVLYLRVRSLAADLRDLQLYRVPVPQPVMPERPVARPVTPPPAPKPTTAPQAAPTPTPRVTEAPRPIPTAAPTASDRLDKLAEATGGWEQLIGGNLLNKLGALVLVIGIALFLSYSFANMGPAGRAFTSIGISGALLACGVVLERQERYRIFSRGILASGWAALYFTSYAMHALPAARIIESPVIGTVLMLAVAAGMVLHSLRYRVQSLTALSYGCIFAALALSSLNTFVAVSLLPLAASMLYLARRFDWHAMALFAAAATYGVFLTRPESGATLAAIESMLVLFWILFEAFDLLRIQSKAGATPFHHTLFAVNALAGVGASAALWYRMAPDSMWLFSSGAALLYLASTWVRFALEGETYYEFSLGISALMTGLAIIARVPGLWSSVGMMIEAEVLFLAAVRLRIPAAKTLSWVAFLAAANRILDSWTNTQTHLIGGLTVRDMTPPLAILAGLFLLNRYLAKTERYWSYLASLSLLVCILIESRVPYLGTAWLGFAALLFEFGARKGLSEFRYQGYGIATLGAAATVLAALDQPVPPWTLAAGAAYFFTQTLRALDLPVWELGIIRRGGSSAATLMLGLWIHRAVPESYEALVLFVTSTLLLELARRVRPAELLLPALTMNGAALFRLLLTHGESIAKWPEPEVWISFGGGALTYAYIMLRLLRGDTDGDRLGRPLSAVLTSALTLLTLSMVLPDPWIPVAFAALGVVLVEIGLFASAADLGFLGRGLSVLSILALTAFAPADLWPRVALSSAITAFQYWMHFRLRRDQSHFVHGLLAALIATATIFHEASGGMLTLSWSLEGIALLAAGFALRDRWLRLPGLALLLLCIGKVFFYDLRNLETVYRILSFIGLGLILLGVSWIYTRFKEQLQKLL